MYHTENGRKYSGEKFDMHKAKEICERYRGILPILENTNKIRVRGNLTLSFCLYCKYFTYTSKNNLFTML